MSVAWVALRDVVEPKPGTLNPSAWPDDPFTYVDVAAVDNKAKTITGARTMKGAEAPSRARRLIRAGDVLVSTVRPKLNAVALVPEALDGEVASTALCVLRANARVLPEYLFFFVRSALFIDGITRLSAGALYPAVSDSAVLDQRLPLPELSEQRRVADLLSCAQSSVRLRREIQKRTVQMTPALFSEVFGDAAAKGQGWPIVQLGSLLDGGPQNGLYKHMDAYGSGTPIVRIDAFRDGMFAPLSALKRVRLDETEKARYALTAEDIVVNRVNSPEHVGKSALVPALAEPTVFESNMMRLRIDPAKASARYVIAAMQTQRTRRHFQINAKRAINQSSLNQQDVRSMPLLLPPLERQRMFARSAEATDDAIDGQALMLKGSEATFAALLARIFAPQR